MVAIAVLDDYQQVALRMADWSGLKAHHEIRVFTRPFGSPDEAAAALAGFEVVCAMRERTPFPAALFGRLPRLKLLVTTGQRNAAIDMDAARAHGVMVCGTPSPAHATAELALGMMIALSRRLGEESRNMQEGRWQTTLGRDLKGRTLGLLGLGRLGGQMAGFALALGMSVIAWSENLTPDAAAAHGATRVDKDGLFSASDVLSIHTKLSRRTTGIVGAREIALMKPDAILINTSRGPIVDTATLIAALERGHLAGAGIDVYDEEPLPADHPLRSAPRTMLTPHIGYVTEETYRIFYGGTVTAIEAWLAGRPVMVL
ncbi:MAG: D-2-hydroxyacid dehydrogenase family protein [Hyphomicrobiales bacterium]|nr:D-2-hydroxyacid dehydrogenase family protein [Hyphomicrobiales bacterium]